MKKINVEESIVYKFDSKEDLSQAVLVLGEKGYFSYDKDFSTYEYGRLYEVRCWLTSCNHPFVLKDDEGNYNSYKYFITEESVVFEEEPKKLRPYGINEFFDKFTMLSRITFREKGNNDCIITCVVNGYRTRPICIDVCLGVEWISLGTLFDKYEYKDTLGNWQPFGVVEENE